MLEPLLNCLAGLILVMAVVQRTLGCACGKM